MSDASFDSVFSFARIEGPAFHGQAAASARNDSSFEFELTTQYLVHLAGSVEIDGDSNSVGVSGVSGLAQITLSGPKFQFDESCTANNSTGINVSCLQTFDTLFTLDPGIYTFSQNRNASYSAFLIFGGSFLEAGVRLDAADFTAIPEPYWTPFVPVLLVAIVAYVTRRNSSVCAGF